MRTLKFRAWNGATMTNIILVSGSGYITSWEVGSSIPNMFNVRWPVMQWTGLCDKNGKDIFEGDILKYAFVRKFKIGKKARTYIGHVEWEGDEYAHYVINPNRINLSTTVVLMEIIGNIFENNELIAS